MNEDQKLIDKVRVAYEAKDLKELCEKKDIEISYSTLGKWNTTGIPKSGTGKQYLKLLLKVKEIEMEKNLYKNVFDSFNKALEHKTDKINK